MYTIEFCKNSWIYNRSISNLMDLSQKLLSYSVTIQVNLFKHSLLAFLKNNILDLMLSCIKSLPGHVGDMGEPWQQYITMSQSHKLQLRSSLIP